MRNGPGVSSFANIEQCEIDAIRPAKEATERAELAEETTAAAVGR
jgi:hypothetical protein